MSDARHLVLIDGSAFIHRAFHAMPRFTRRTDGMNVGAINGYCEMLWSMIRKNLGRFDGWCGTHMIVVFDHKSPNFRHRLFPAYKANRPPMDPELKEQLPLMRDATRAFGIPSIELEGHEADDIIATLARQAASEVVEVTIVTSDKDLMQLVGPMIVGHDPIKKKRMDAAAVFEKFGVWPSELGDYLAMLGDTVDNVPGLPGVGAKTAVGLLETFGDIEAMIARAEEIPQKKRRETVQENVEALRLSRKLVDLDVNVPVSIDWTAAELSWPRRLPIAAFLKRMTFASLLIDVTKKLERERGYGR